MMSQNRKTYIAPHFSRIVIMGVGGTGSYLAQGLAKLFAGYQLELDVVLVDPDTIEEKNCSRQNFQSWEIGQPKAHALAYRLNQQYGTSFAGLHDFGDRIISPTQHHDRLVISCVDTVEARKPLRDSGYWLDLGNGQETGQAIYGSTSETAKLKTELKKWDTTPTVGHLPSPYVVAGMAKLKTSKKKAPSCADTPFAEQGIFANEWAATAGLAILHQLLIKGQLTIPAIYFDTSRGRMTPEYITREYLNQ
jgi:PRTRC genetic system ThiF family protein